VRAGTKRRSKPENAERYRDRSPIFFIVDCVAAPVQVIAGRTNPRCPVAKTEQVYDALYARGIPVEMVTYEDEGHGFGEVENPIDAYRRRAAFFARHIGRETTQPGYGPTPHPQGRLEL